MTSVGHRCLRVGHAIVRAGASLDDLPARLADEGWDMVELDVLDDRGMLVVAHDRRDLDHPRALAFGEALVALRDQLPQSTRINVDVKTTGYERRVVEAIGEAGLQDRTLVSTMELASLRVIRALAPRLALGLSVPKVRRDPFASRLTRPGAHAMLAYLRRALPRQAARVLAAGEADAIMAYHGVVTGRLVSAVCGRGAELFAWTVDDPERCRALERLGVTGIITNESDVFLHAGLD